MLSWNDGYIIGLSRQALQVRIPLRETTIFFSSKTFFFECLFAFICHFIWKIFCGIRLGMYQPNKNKKYSRGLNSSATLQNIHVIMGYGVYTIHCKVYSMYNQWNSTQKNPEIVEILRNVSFDASKMTLTQSL